MAIPESEFEVPADFWHRLENGKVQCDLCPRFCHLSEGQRGLCFVRQRKHDGMVLTSYGRSSGFCVDPIEKKPLNHFYPGTPVLSFGTAGCNLACKFCQNWDISKSRQVDAMAARASPETLARAAVDSGCEHIAFTYNDPVIFHEYARDAAIACRELGINTVAVTAAYLSESAREAFFRHIDGVNIDLKAFSEEFYYRLCGGHLQEVLDTILFVHQETDIWMELTTLLIPGHNDSERELCRLVDWILEHLGNRVPLHFSAFHPDWKMRDTAPTPPSTLYRARKLARQRGLLYVYTGNINYLEGGTTFCPQCGTACIVRDWYAVKGWHLNAAGHCRSCGASVDGRFHSSAGTWGNHRQVLQLAD